MRKCSTPHDTLNYEDSNDSNEDFLTDAQSLYEEDSESIESIMAKAKQFEYKDDENEN